MNVKEYKRRIRERIWRLLEEKNIAAFPRPVYGRIPNFLGADKAARKLFSLKIWKTSKVVKVNPDSPQKAVRLQALHEGKLLLMPTPRLREGFILLDPKLIPRRYYYEASTIRGAFKWGRIVSLDEIPKVDLITIGSVAVDQTGTRIGKGGGYAELEYGILKQIGRVSDTTPIATTVHDIQVLKEELPREEHDLPVDVIITPTKIIEASKPFPKPPGIIWRLVTEDMLNKIKPLRELKRKQSY
ncbi:MAG: 5-formyltetrahydrofolate cyclo-ligase [Thermoprotei archaeon]|nr:MAG: 5-formyltetrahydrofolate cyclo-ligase [Thermoprotei archaeon]RLF01709.1 MAG: 5-formyltetrahydrofolate cyclo-ligase [Thermoprotei archaeon]